MRVHPRFPSHAAGGADITGNGRLKKGERVIDTQNTVENMPSMGTLCLKESYVLAAVKKLGYTIADAELLEQLDELAAENVRLREIADKYATIQGALS